LIDGPYSITGVSRQVLGLKRISLTDVVVKGLNRSARVKSIETAWNEQGIMNEWTKSSWAKKIAAKKTRASLGDFQRFKVMVAKKQKSKIVAEKLAQLK
jgi:large subunit ribosomal protein L14e